MNDFIVTKKERRKFVHRSLAPYTLFKHALKRTARIMNQTHCSTFVAKSTLFFFFCCSLKNEIRTFVIHCVSFDLRHETLYANQQFISKMIMYKIIRVKDFYALCFSCCFCFGKHVHKDQNNRDKEIEKKKKRRRSFVNRNFSSIEIKIMHKWIHHFECSNFFISRISLKIFKIHSQSFKNQRVMLHSLFMNVFVWSFARIRAQH